MKKLITVMLALVLCVGMMAVAASAAGTPALAVSSTTGAAGKTVDVTVTLSNNPGIAMLEFGVDYDSSRLTLEGMTTTGLDGAMASTSYIWVTTNAADSKYEGKILTISFKVKEDAAPGAADIKLTGINCGNWAEEVISVSASAGKVTLACDHEYGEWTVTKEATCTEAGEQTRTCAKCGDVETKAIDALGHKWGEWETTKKATCQEKGEKTRTCERCGEVDTKEIKKADHKYKDGKCIWCGKKKPGYDNVPSTGDITSVVTMGVVAMISVVAAAAYVTKRRITK